MNYKHSGGLGDIILGLWVLRAKPGHLFLHTGIQGCYAPGIKHPSGDYRMSDKLALWLLPLLRAQPYILSCDLWKHDRKIDVDLDSFRRTGISYLWGTIPRWYNYSNEAWWDLSTPWLEVPTAEGWADKIVINRTGRYRNERIKWNILDKYDVVFVGLEQEYNDVKSEIPRLKYHPCVSALDMAIIIKSCRMFVGNASCALAMAEAMKVPRILETCMKVPNVIPMGGKFCYDAIQQKGFDWGIEECLRRTATNTNAVVT